jgi:DNA-binding SARP family transcriptional activator/Tfp pilus assembly protein PilF
MDRRNESDPSLVEAAPFELRVLGQLELVHVQSGELIPLPAAKMRALVAYLAAAPRLTAERRQIAGLLWASSGERQARQSMRQLLSNFRRDIDPRASAILAFDETSVNLNSSMVVIDRTILLETRGEADLSKLARAADLYRNDFGLALEIGDNDFDAWLHSEQMRSREAAVTILDSLIRALIALGRHDEALKRANRLAEIEPLREETHRLAISQEAIVSGRASAMQRYETFRVLLRDELGVRPEAATLHLLEELRQQQPALTQPIATIGDPSKTGGDAASPALKSHGGRRTWRRPALAAGLAAFLLLGGVVLWRLSSSPIAQTSESDGRAAVAILPFDFDAHLDALRAQGRAYESEAKLAFARNRLLSVVESPRNRAARGPIAHYIVKTSVAETADGARAEESLFDSATGARIFATPMPMSGDKTAFASELYELVYPALVLDRADKLSVHDPNSNAALLWRAEAEQTKRDARIVDPPEFALFETVLARNPDQIDALLGLADGLIQRAARDLSKGVSRTDDMTRAASLLEHAKSQAPNLAKVAFLEGMLAKLQSNFAAAYESFEIAAKRDPSDLTPTIQAAHVRMFLGEFEEAYARIEAIPDIPSESAFISGEMALMAGHSDLALAYYDQAISASPNIPRNYAWRAVALWRVGRKTEAHENALKSQNMTPPYLTSWMAHRGQFADKRYRDARDACVAIFTEALTYASTN